MTRWPMLFIMLAAGGAFTGCGSSVDTQLGTPESRFAHAKELFDKGDYVEAITEFQIVTLQFSGSAFASEAQFYLGECHFAREEYLLGAFEYQQLRRNYPASPRAADAEYKLATCYYKLSPKIRLDQQYTKKAIDEFQSFLEYYPGNPSAVIADSLIHELTTKLAAKQIQTARLYSTMGYVKATLFYYDDVIERYHDTEFGPLAYIEKAEFLVERKKFADADAVITRFIAMYPNSVLRGRADLIKQQITTGIGGNAGAANEGKGKGEASQTLQLETGSQEHR